MLAWYRALIRLRRITPSLQNGEPGHTRVIFNEVDMTFSMERGDVTLCCNLDNTDRQFSVQEGSRIILSSRTVTPIERGSLTLQPDTVAIIKSSRTD
jgi:maltooligosyltrehalose trehalohydrolase